MAFPPPVYGMLVEHLKDMAGIAPEFVCGAMRKAPMRSRWRFRARRLAKLSNRDDRRSA
jgi:hypothetical protein